MLTTGKAWPLGATPVIDDNTDGINFAVWAPDASRVELCLFDAHGLHEQNRLDLPGFTDGVWHGFLPYARPGLVYGLRAHGEWAPQRGHRFNPAKVLLDPWATEVVGCYGRQRAGTAADAALEAELERYVAHAPGEPTRPDPRDNADIAIKARVGTPLVPGKTRPLGRTVPPARTVIYEAHVRSLTMRHPGIPAALRGSYAAVVHPAMIAHYRKLGITSLSLLPLHFRADEAALQRRGLANHWGYAPIAWLAPETRYWSGRSGTSPESELCDMIDQLHAAGFEVLLDVVFNHTAETDEHGPTLSLRGLANARYYHLAPGNPAHYANWTGCGNSLNLAEPRVVQLVMGALRHWHQHYRIDGFRFDLATSLARDRHGHFDRSAGFFAALQSDPVLSHVKLIAEPWDIGAGGYQLGAFPAGWLEWNDQFRDTLRAWWLQRTGDRGVFAHRFAASSGQFHHDARAPVASVNFLTAHDGFTLADLVSYNHKHNQPNGEHNRDGHHHNQSWNCGIEGATDDPGVRALRARLRRALLASLLCAQGTPMLLAGDELGHSQQGNNNAYCQDNEITWLDWTTADTALIDCVARLIALRHRHAALRQPNWLTGPREAGDAHTVRWWHPDGGELRDRDWNDTADPALAIVLRPAPAPTHAPCPHAADESAAVLLLINPDLDPRRFSLPRGCWQAVFDSARDDGQPAPPITLTAAADGDVAWVAPPRTFSIFVDRPPPTHAAPERPA